jgi:hypothetical protein
MPRRKLSPKVKQFLYQNRWKVKKSNYSGDALAYLQRLRAASKGARTRANNTAYIGKTKIPRNSELYRVIHAAAGLKGQTVKKFISSNKAAIQRFVKDGSVVISRETEYAISDIKSLPRSSKIFIGGLQVSKEQAILALQTLQSTSMNVSNIVVLNHELKYDLLGNLHLDIPQPEDYGDLLDEIEEYNDSGETDAMLMSEQMWMGYLDEYDTIVYIKS